MQHEQNELIDNDFTYTTIKRAGPAVGGKQHDKREPFADVSTRLATRKQGRPTGPKQGQH